MLRLVAHNWVCSGKVKEGGMMPTTVTGMTVHANRSSDDAAVGSEAGTPQSIADQNSGRGLCGVFFRQEEAAQSWLYAEERKEASADDGGLDSLRKRTARNACLAAAVGGHH